MSSEACGREVYFRLTFNDSHDIHLEGDVEKRLVKYDDSDV